jgi:hypothetical protein
MPLNCQDFPPSPPFSLEPSYLPGVEGGREWWGWTLAGDPGSGSGPGPGARPLSYFGAGAGLGARPLDAWMFVLPKQLSITFLALLSLYVRPAGHGGMAG